MDEATGAEKAIELCEHLKQWDMYLGVVATEGLDGLKEKLRSAVYQAMIRADPERKKVLTEALDQWDHPDLMRYFYQKVMQLSMKDEIEGRGLDKKLERLTGMTLDDLAELPPMSFEEFSALLERKTKEKNG
jgi:hypothetical protein